MEERLYYGWGIAVYHLDSFNSVVLDNGNIIKHFKGETAWSDAERYANDTTLERLYA